MDDLYNLEVLSLVAKITQEIDNHTGINDKTLAEFVINLHEQSKDLDEFKQKLKEVGADFPDSFSENTNRLILNMHPKYKKKLADAALSKEDEDTEREKNRQLFPGLSLPNQDPPMKDAIMKEVDDLMNQFEGIAQKARNGRNSERSPKRRRTERSSSRSRSRSPPARRRSERSRSPNRRRSPSPSRGRDYGDRWDRNRGRDGYRNGRPLDDRPVLYKIYNGRITGMKEFGAFVQLEGIAGRVEGESRSLDGLIFPLLIILSKGMVHVSNIQQGIRANAPSDLLTRGQSVKVKVISVAGSRIGLSMKDVDQATGRDLTPHLRIKSEAELEEERMQALRMASSGANAIPLNSRDTKSARSAKRLTSPERWEIKQLISSGAIDASEYPELDEDMHNPVAHVEMEEDIDVEVREDEPSFLKGQTKRALDLSPVRVVKAPDGSLNRAAQAAVTLAKERRELRQQEANEEADSQALDFSVPWLDPMSKESDRIFAQDLKGHLRGQKAGEIPQWKGQSSNKIITFGELSNLSIQEQRRNLPIYKFREPLLKAIAEVCTPDFSPNILCLLCINSIRFLWSSETLVQERLRKWSSISPRQAMLRKAG
jgi:ATP-dependent RNA helicase DHX8/PRP22